MAALIPVQTVAKSFVGGKWVKATELSAKQAAKVRAGGQYAKARRVAPELAAYRKTTKSRQFTQLRQAVSTGSNQEGMDRFAASHNFAAFTHRVGSKSGGRSYVFNNSNALANYTSENTKKKAVRHFALHEGAHADRKRSEYRIHGQIGSDPEKLGREEGRADFLASGHYKHPRNRRDSWGQRVSGYQDQVRMADSPIYRASIKSVRGMAVEDGDKKLVRLIDTESGRVTGFARGYNHVQDRMKAAGTKVRKGLPFSRS